MSTSNNTRPQTHVPDVAAQWINRCVLGLRLQNSTEQCLSTPGHQALNTLTVPELKRVCSALRRTSIANRFLDGYKTSRKADIIQMIRRIFYVDYPTCNIVKADALQELSRHISTSTSPAAVAAAPTAQRPTPLAPANTAPAAFAMGQFVGQNTFAAMPRIYAANGAVYQMRPQLAPYSFPPPPPPSTGQKRNFHTAFPAAEIHQAMQAYIGTSSSSESRTSTSSSPVFVKAESNGGDPETTPQNDAERSALGQLQQMGFNDNREILASYRRLLEANNAGRPPSVDEVMLDLVTQREEQEEALRMDEARKLSEASRKEDAKRRRQELEQELQVQMESSSIEEWLANDDMFAESWLLQGDAKDALAKLIGTEKTSLKVKLIDLLKLEQKAIKWYGTALPRGYFQRKVTDRLVPIKTAETMLSQIQTEVATLEVVMYQLCHQTGGVPKVFRDAHDEARANDGDDTEVLLVDASPPGHRPVAAAAVQEKKAPAAEIIDIL